MILEVLTTIYPGHPWAVRVYDGGFFIRHLDFPSQWGMNCKYRDFAHDAAVLKREIILKAGEWLERANMKRGRYDADQPAYRVEGVPERFQPPEFREPAAENMKIEMVLPQPETLRETPRPQAVKAS